MREISLPMPVESMMRGERPGAQTVGTALHARIQHVGLDLGQLEPLFPEPVYAFAHESVHDVLSAELGSDGGQIQVGEPGAAMIGQVFCEAPGAVAGRLSID